MGKSFIPIPSSQPLQHPNSHMSHVYYAQSPGHIYAQELTEGLLTYEDTTQLCTEKYLQAKCDKELTVATTITTKELQQAREQFANPAKTLLSSSALLPLVQGVPDDDSARDGATPSHQQDTQDIDTELLGSGKDSKDPGQWALLIPPCLETSTRIAEEHEGAMQPMEGRTVPESGGDEESKA